MSKHYDVVVLGASLGALSTAALLARRSWRVLVLGQGYRPSRYSFDGLELARRPFTFLAAASPAWKRVLVELAQTQAFRRQVHAPDPMFQVLDGKVRISLPSDREVLVREVLREFPEVRRVVDELYAELARANAATDAAFEHDVVWSPGTFWERRETARAAAVLPYRRDQGKDLLAEFPEGHPFRSIATVPASFASDVGEPLSTLSLARLFGAWAHGLVLLGRGEEDLTDFLVDRVRAHGGEVLLGGRASEVLVHSGRVTGVHIDGDEEVTGAQFLATDMPSADLLYLASQYRPPRRIIDARPGLEVASQRFVTSIAVSDAGIPAPLATESFLLPGSDAEPVVHVQRLPQAGAFPATTLLVAETLVSTGEPFDRHQRERMRAFILATIERYFPYVESHYLLVDSPHDGLPLWDYRSGARQPVSRADLRGGGASLEPEPMRPVFRVTGGTDSAFVGEPLRYPLTNAFGVGSSILPGLGQEGELLAAWGSARIITRTNRQKEKMRREMWSKVELG